MNNDSVFHDSKPQTCTAQLTWASFIYAVKAFEQTVQVFRWNAYSCIGKTKIIEILVFAETVDINMDICSGIGYGIVCKISENGV